jgi:hypothetical protein
MAVECSRPSDAVSGGHDLITAFSSARLIHFARFPCNAIAVDALAALVDRSPRALNSKLASSAEFQHRQERLLHLGSLTAEVAGHFPPQ